MRGTLGVPGIVEIRFPPGSEGTRDPHAADVGALSDIRRLVGSNQILLIKLGQVGSQAVLWWVMH